MQKKTINKKRLNKYICIISIQLDTMRNKNICKFNLNNDIPDVTNLFFLYNVINILYQYCTTHKKNGRKGTKLELSATDPIEIK